MRRRLAVAIVLGVSFAVVAGAGIVAAGTENRPVNLFPGACCFFNGEEVKTVAVPAALPNGGNEGVEDMYVFPGGLIAGQKLVVNNIPGQPGWSGGRWAIWTVRWNVAPYVLHSEAEVLAARAAGDVTVTRRPDLDFRCPISTGKP